MCDQIPMGISILMTTSEFKMNSLSGSDFTTTAVMTIWQCFSRFASGLHFQVEETQKKVFGINAEQAGW